MRQNGSHGGIDGPIAVMPVEFVAEVGSLSVGDLEAHEPEVLGVKIPIAIHVNVHVEDERIPRRGRICLNRYRGGRIPERVRARRDRYSRHCVGTLDQDSRSKNDNESRQKGSERCVRLGHIELSLSKNCATMGGLLVRTPVTNRMTYLPVGVKTRRITNRLIVGRLPAVRFLCEPIMGSRQP